MSLFISNIFRHGLVGHRTFENARDFNLAYLKPLIVVYYDVDFVKNFENTVQIRNQVLKIAQELKDDVKFAISNSFEMKRELADFAVDPMTDGIYVASKNIYTLEKFKLIGDYS
jgi:protein disulfide isomerase family A protein 3